nr:hypothetical protein [Mesorhizobium sp.]
MSSDQDVSETTHQPRAQAHSERQITLGELTSCTDGKLVVAECMDTQRPRHIDDVANGLRCRCVCPGCRRRMVAHQGELRRHFQHAAEGVDCRSAGESALHRFAKDVLAEALRLRLPELKAYHGDESLPVVAEQEFAFDSAVLEQRTGDIIPDVVCRKGGRSLHVEFKVTHACGPEKIDKLRAMDIGAIEIDLSRYRDVPLEDLDQAILAEAPRAWLHNPRQVGVKARLKENERTKLASEDRRAETLLNGLKPIPQGQIGEFERLALSAGLADLLATDDESVGFLVSGREWRAFVLMHFAIRGTEFLHQRVFEGIKARRWIAEGFAYVSKADVAAIQRVTGRETLPPWQSLWGFLSRLQSSGFLNDTLERGGYVAGVKLRKRTEAWRYELEKPQRRTDELRALFDGIVARIRTASLKEGLTFDGWFGADIGHGVVPVETIGDDDAFMDISDRLAALLRGMSSFPARADEPLGFPVIKDLEIRAEARREVEARQEVERATRARNEADEREERLRTAASREMAADIVSTWMEQPQARLNDLCPREAARQSDSSYQRALYALERWGANQRREVEAANRRLDLLDKLRREARAAFRNPEHADLWVGSSTPKLGGKRPEDHCVDEATYKECLAILADIARRRR